MTTEHSPLKPTFWRTCRALANRLRLRMLKSLFEHPGRTVTQIAAEMKLSTGIASQYLRMLNARGLLRAMRKGREVVYTPGADPSIPCSTTLLRILKAGLAGSETRVEDVFCALTAFTHPRRIALIRVLTARPMRLWELRARTGISKQAAHRHLTKLESRGFVSRRGYLYRGKDPRTPLKRALLRIVLDGK